MSTFTHNGIKYERDDVHSCRDFTGWDWNDRESLDGLVIEGSCFSQETPDRQIFPEKMTGVTFIMCNMDNCFIPKGNTVIDCSRKRFEVQNDGEDWLIDDTGMPFEPIAKKHFEQLGLSTNPNDIPSEEMEKSIILEKLEEIQGGKPLPDDKFTPPA